MAKFLAITSRGLLEPLCAELQELGVKNVRQCSDSVQFEGPWSDVYRVHLHSRIATRVLMPVAEFTAYNEDDLYYGIFRKHDFTQHIFPQQTLRVEAHVRDHRNLRDQRFVAMKVKDALVDQFWQKFNERPSVGDQEEADLRVVVRVVGPKVSVSVDLTGETISNRGYRRFVGEAPLREHVAAGILRISKWSAPQPLLDPFCGSGTVLIEAALSEIGLGGLKRRTAFCFERLRGFQPEVWSEFQREASRDAVRKRTPPAKPFLFGFDVNASVIEKARANARAAGVENWISFRVCDVRDLKPPTELAGWIVTNPPYGERLGTKSSARELMFDFSKVLKSSFKNWNAWILSGDGEVSSGLKLKARRKIPVHNGPIECRLLNYPIA